MSSQIIKASRRIAEADEVVVEHPRVKEAHATFDRMRARAAQGSPRGTTGVLMVGPTQTGKSTTIHSYVELMNTDEALGEGRIPALVVTLQANQTRKGLSQDILKSFDRFGLETGWKSGTEYALFDRVQKALIYRKTEILILDEFHHLVHSDNKNVASSVAETIKTLLIEGSPPIVMSGIEDAWRPIKANTQLAMRCEQPLEMKKLDMRNEGDRTLFATFLTKYLVELEVRQIAPGASSLLLLPDVPDMIHEVSDGVLGRACNLVKEALFITLMDGREQIGIDDLAVAAEHKFVSMGIVKQNPFSAGLSPLSRDRELA